MSKIILKPDESGTLYDKDLKVRINKYGTLTDNQVVLSQYALQMANAYVHATIPDATVLVAHNMFLGTLCEYAFALWLFEHDHDFQTDLCIGRPDKFDMKIYDEVYDMKSTNIDYCMYVKKYHVDNKPAIYVWCQRNVYNDNSAVVTLLGWNTPDDIKEYGKLIDRFEDIKYQVHKSVWRSMDGLAMYLNDKSKTCSKS